MACSDVWKSTYHVVSEFTIMFAKNLAEIVNAFGDYCMEMVMEGETIFV